MPAGLDGNPDPVVTPARTEVLTAVADGVLGRKVDGRALLVAIDGVDGSGKSTFAYELAAVLSARGANPVRSTVDSFHHPRAVRWRRGRSSPVGFYRDSHDLAALRRRLLDPLRAGPGSRYRTAWFDEPSDRPIDDPERPVDGSEILVFDGLFLARPELRTYWNHRIFLDGADRVNLTRLGLVLAEAPAGGVELIEHTLQWVARIDRYASGMRLYLDQDDPVSTADVVIDNNDVEHPLIVQR